MLKHIPIFMIKFLTKHSRFNLVAGIASLALAFSACTDVDNTLGDDFIDPSQKGEVLIDSSFVIDTYTYTTDKFATSTYQGKCYIGSYNDPTFGQITSSVATQFGPYSLSDYKLKAASIGAKLDSVVLTLKLKGGVGDSLAVQNLMVYQMKAKIYTDTIYYSNYKIKDSIETASINDGSKKVGYDRKGDKVIRVRLSNDFGKSLANVDTSKIKSFDDFIAKFKGLYFESEQLAAGGGLNQIDFADTSSRLHVYFKVAGSKGDSLVRMPFLISTSYMKFSVINHTYNGTSPYRPNLSQLNPDLTANPTSNDLVYVQGLGGLRTVVKFDNAASLAKFENKGYKIHRAELVFEPYFPNGTISYRTLPSALTAYYTKTVSGKDALYYVPDMYSFRSVSSNAYYNRSKRHYSLNISSYFKNAMRDSSYPKKLYILAGIPSTVASSSTSSYPSYSELPNEYSSIPTQLIIGKPGKSNHVKLIITYTK